ncbi:MAG: hypothetical protein ACI93H_000897, partial [Psychromonas sp.]
CTSGRALRVLFHHQCIAQARQLNPDNRKRINKVIGFII